MQSEISLVELILITMNLHARAPKCNKKTEKCVKLNSLAQNSSVTDDSLAPKGKSAVYVLVPVLNSRNHIDGDNKEKDYKETGLDTVKERTKMNDIRDHIEIEKNYPRGWEKDYNVYIGATFNLARNLLQMLYFRPHNRCGELKNPYLVGGGTYSGSGLHTIYISGIVTARLISKNN